MDVITFLFSEVLVNPMLNILVVLYSILFSNFGLALITFTIIVRLLTTPLTLKQMKQMRAMTGLQPRMKEVQARYANDPKKRSQEMMNVYKQAGVNPLGCLGPMIIQLPIWIGLYQALLKSLGTNPDDLVGLAQRLYSWNPVGDSAVPLNSNFLWLDLAAPDPSPLILPILVGVSTWAQQKMTTMPAMDERQQSTNNMMLWMMPIMLGFFALTFPSGLALYWTISNCIGIATQGFITKDWDPIIPSFLKPRPAPDPTPPPPPAQEEEPKETQTDGTTTVEANVRKNRRGSHRSGAERARRRPGRGRNRNIKPR